MKVLVTAASKHGSTTEIAEAIGRHLTDAGLTVEVTGPKQVHDLADYDAVVLGSAVYAGHWLDPAKELVERLRDALSSRPVWLFSSGPIGDPPAPEEDAVEVADIVEATGARDHCVLPGNVDMERLRLPEKAIVRALRVPVGDYRDWDAVATWATAIAGALQEDTGATTA